MYIVSKPYDSQVSVDWWDDSSGTTIGESDGEQRQEQESKEEQGKE